jgi:hypothetical protein
MRPLIKVEGTLFQDWESFSLGKEYFSTILEEKFQQNLKATSTGDFESRTAVNFLSHRHYKDPQKSLCSPSLFHPSKLNMHLEKRKSCITRTDPESDPISEQ